MKVVLVLAAAAVALSGCNILPKPTPEPLSVTVKALADAAREGGSNITFSHTFGGGVGQIGGGLNLSDTLSGGCDPSKVQSLKQFGESLPDQKIPAR